MGLLGVFGIWLTAGIALPYVNYLHSFEPEQLMTARGCLTAVIALVALLYLKRLRRPDSNLLLVGLSFAVACFCLFKGIRAWGASLTIVVITATPVVTMLISQARGQTPALSALIALIGIMTGVVIATAPAASLGEEVIHGFLWSLGGVVTNALFYEALRLCPDDRYSSLEKCFWQAVVLTVFGIAVGGVIDPAVLADSQALLYLVGFALVGGFLYFLANILAFGYLSHVSASVLAQGETPAVMVMAAVLLGEQLSALQWFGALLAVVAACWLAAATAQTDADSCSESVNSA